jgi:hypothetical protein
MTTSVRPRSPHSLRALRWAAFVAGAVGSRIEAVTAWESPSTYGWATMPSGWDPARDMEGVLREAVRQVSGDQPPMPIEMSVREGGAARVLLDASQGADASVRSWDYPPAGDSTAPAAIASTS